MTEYSLDDVTAGESWGCRFRINTMLDAEGVPLDTKYLQPGDAAPGTPGVYESTGVIRVRDRDSRQLLVLDMQSPREFVVSYDDVWDVDRVEYREDT